MPWKKKPPPPRKKAPPLKPAPTPPKKTPVLPPVSKDGLVAPLTRVNVQGVSVPQFVVELRIGNPPVAANFTIDTMGRDTTMPWELCSNATRTKSAIVATINKDDKEKDWKKPSMPPPSTSPPSSTKPSLPTPPPTKPSTPPPSSTKPSLPTPSPTKPSTPPPSSTKPLPATPSPPGATYAVPCSHPICKGPSFVCHKLRNRCVSYDRFSGKSTDLVVSELTMQSVYPSGAVSSQNRTLDGIVMGCGAPSSLNPSSLNAVVSLSPGPTSLFSQLAAAANLPRKFAYCLGKSRGAFFLGGADHAFRQQSIKPNMTYLPMMTPPSTWERGMGYRLALRGIAVGSGPHVTPLPIDSSLFDNGVVIGTKLRYTSLIDPAYQVVRSHFLKMASAQSAKNSSIAPVASPFPELNLCYQIPHGVAVSGAPKIQFIFKNATLTVEPRNYIVRWQRTNVVCLGIVSSGPLGRVSVIGTLQQEETLVEFDMDKLVVGVSEQLTLSGNSCRNFGFLPSSSHEDGSFDDVGVEDIVFADPPSP